MSYYCNNRFPLHNCWTTNIVIRCRNDQHLQTSICCAKIHCNVILTWKKIHKIQGPRIPCIAMPFVVCFQKLSLSEIHKSIVQDCIYNYNIKFCKGCNMRRLVAAKIITKPTLLFWILLLTNSVDPKDFGNSLTKLLIQSFDNH